MNTAANQYASKAACVNCNTALQSHYHHQSGQRAHNPINRPAHALEEVFQSN